MLPASSGLEIRALISCVAGGSGGASQGEGGNGGGVVRLRHVAQAAGTPVRSASGQPGPRPVEVVYDISHRACSFAGQRLEALLLVIHGDMGNR